MKFLTKIKLYSKTYFVKIKNYDILPKIMKTHVDKKKIMKKLNFTDEK